MKKAFLLLIIVFTVLSFSACSQDVIDEPQQTTAIESPVPTVLPTDPAVEQTEILQNISSPSANSINQVESPQPDIGIKATSYVHHLYTRFFDLDGNYLNNGHCTYSICGSCKEMGSWFDEICTHCGAEFTSHIDVYEYETYTCDADNWEIIYDVSYEPFEVK